MFEEILRIASRPRSTTKDACVKLCGFVQLCVKSKQEALRQWAFQETTATHLFDYYLEWNEKDQHRSMRLVLDQVSVLILQNLDPQLRESLKAKLVPVLVQVIARRSRRPVVKSCISALTQFLAKSVCTLADVALQYVSLRPELAREPSVVIWQRWIAEIFTWMELHYICPMAGKHLVLVFTMLYVDNVTGFDIGKIRASLETACSIHPDILESVKNNVFAPMFKSNRRIAIALLGELNRSLPGGQKDKSEDDVTALLHLAALEVGKKTSIVDDTSEYCICM